MHNLCVFFRFFSSCFFVFCKPGSRLAVGGTSGLSVLQRCFLHLILWWMCLETRDKFKLQYGHQCLLSPVQGKMPEGHEPPSGGLGVRHIEILSCCHVPRQRIDRERIQRVGVRGQRIVMMPYARRCIFWLLIVLFNVLFQRLATLW